MRLVKTVIHRSDFTGADLADITGLTPATGGAVSLVSGTASLVKSNRAYTTGTLSAHSIPNVPTFPYQIEAVVRVMSVQATESITLSVRATTNFVYYLSGSGSVNCAGSGVTGTVTESVSISAGVDYTLKIIMLSSTRAVCYFDGMQVFGGEKTLTDVGTLVAPRFVHDTVAASTTTGLHIDWVEVANLTAATTRPKVFTQPARFFPTKGTTEVVMGRPIIEAAPAAPTPTGSGTQRRRRAYAVHNSGGGE